MRTDDEIAAKMRELEGGSQDFFGFMRSDLVGYLSFEAAKPFLKEDAVDDGWVAQPRDDASLIAAMTKYMDFAWEKANDCRGLSAGRSLNHMSVWLWMLGEDDAADALDDYDLYGKPQLRAICEHYGIDWRALDDGHWRNSEDGDGSPAPAETISLPFNQKVAA